MRKIFLVLLFTTLIFNGTNNSGVAFSDTQIMDYLKTKYGL